MRKQKIALAFICISIMAVLIIFSITNRRNSSADNESSSPTATETQEKLIQVHYSEGDENINYNYIINPDALIGTDIGVEALSVLGDKLNEYLENAEYYKNEITLKNVKQKVNIISFICKLSTTNDIVNVTYDLEENTYDMYISVVEE